MKSAHFALLCFILSGITPGYSYGKTLSAGEHVREFYQFYIRSGTKVTIDSDLTEYVDGCMLHSLRIMYERAYFSTDYFAKSQDIADDWLDVLVVHNEIKINDKTSVVPITFKWSEDKQHHLLVFVKKELNGWRIIKVASTNDYYE